MFTFESRKDKKASAKPFPKLRDKRNVKLTFAEKMYRLEQEVKHGKDEHVRTVTEVEYMMKRQPRKFSTSWAI